MTSPVPADLQVLTLTVTVTVDVARAKAFAADHNLPVGEARTLVRNEIAAQLWDLAFVRKVDVQPAEDGR